MLLIVIFVYLDFLIIYSNLISLLFLQVAMSLAQIGEFAFVLLSHALILHLVEVRLLLLFLLLP